MRNGLNAVQKTLLWVTGLALVGFIFTFPTKNNRSTVDKIRMHVGAKHLVSPQTWKDIKKEESRKLASSSGVVVSKPSGKKPARQIAQGANSVKESQKKVRQYCNQDYNQRACGLWLNYCGESCRTLVSQNTWTRLSKAKRSAR